MKKNYKKNNYNKIQKFSIRKYSFGAASVAIASYLMFMGNGAVFADEATVTENTAAKTEEVVTTGEPKKEEAPKVVGTEIAEEKAQKELVASKEKLASYVKEIEGNLSSGKYESKTEESLALLRDAISKANQAANATTKVEVEKAYANLITTVNAKLKSKPVEKKETQAVDTTNGKETVGKKAENTEKKSDSNSIDNTGSKDPRNGKVMDKDNAFRTEATAATHEATTNKVGNISYTMEFSDDAKKEIYLYNQEDTNVDITVNSTAGNISSVKVRGGGNRPLDEATKDSAVQIDGFGWSYKQTLTETPGPVTMNITGKTNERFLGLPPTNRREDQNSVLGDRYLVITDAAGGSVSASSNGVNQPGYFKLVVKSQTYKYSIQQPAVDGDKIGVDDINNLTTADIEKIKNQINIEYSKTSTDARLSSKKGTALENKSDVVKNIEVNGGNITVTYKDDSTDTATISSVVRNNVAPTVSIPYSDPAPNKKEVYLYTGEESNVEITFNDDSGKIKSAALKKGGNIALNNVAGNPDIQDNEYGFTVTAINSESATPAKIKVTGQVSGIAENRLPKTENDSLELVTRFATATDKDGKYIINNAVKNKNNGEIVGTYLTDPGAVTFVLKAQAKKYDMVTPTEADKVAVADPTAVTDEEFAKIKAQLEYSRTNEDKNLESKRGEKVDNTDNKIATITKEGNNIVATYKDGSKDVRPLSDFTKLDKQPAIDAVNTATTEKIAAINATPNATDEEKAVAIAKVNADKEKALTAINDATAKAALDTAKESGTNAIAADNPVVAKKDEAKKAIEAALTAKNNVIDGRDDLTPAQKTAAKEKAAEEAKKAKEAVDAATTDAAVDQAKTAGETAVAAVTPVAKEPAKQAIAKALEDKNAEIEKRTDLTADEKAKAKEEAKKLADAQLAEIAKQPDAAETPEAGQTAQTAVDAAKKTGVDDVTAVNPEAVTKPAAKKAIDDKLAEQLKTIENTPDATEDEKKVAAEQAKTLAELAKKEIDNKTTDADVNQFTDTEKAEIEKVLPVVEDKPNARKAIDEEATAKKEAIEARTDLTPKAKEDLKAEVDKLAKEAKKAVDNATTTDEVNGVEEAGKTAIQSVGAVNIPANKVLVNDPSALTDEEKAKVLEAVKKVNPDAKEITQDADGNVTVTTPDGHKEIITPEQVVKTSDTANEPKAGNDVVKPADKVVVADPTKLTDAEKEKIKAAVKAVNPNSVVTVDEKGNAKVSTQDGQTQVIPVDELVRTAEDTKKPNAGNDIVKPADKTVVANPDALTPEEKKAIEDKVKAVNPGATVVVDDKGNATVTTPEGKTAVIPSTDLVKSPEDATKPNAGNDIVKPADKTAVANKDALTPEEKKAIEDKVKAVNPGATVVVDDKGNATVTTPEGKTAVIPASDLTKTAEEAAKPNAGNDIVKPADKTVVSNSDALTPEEKKAIEDKVKAVNPGATVVVDDKGNATVTTPEGKTAVIPASDLVKSQEEATKPNAGNDIVKPADKTVVANPDALTPEEKKAIEDKVKAVNPDATVVVDDKGNATVTTPEGKTAVIPASDLTKSAADAAKPNAGNDVNTPAAKTVVANPDVLTPEEKKAIEDKVKAVNPGATVVVDDKGNATVTTPEGKTAVIPSSDLVKTQDDTTKENAGNDVNTPAAKTVVANPDALTPEEKKVIEDKVKAVNSGATVVVDDKGNATVTKGDGTVLNIPALDLVIPAENLTDAAKNTAIKTPAFRTLVGSKEQLTDSEKESVKKAIEAVNPGATVVVDDKGNATVTLPDGSTATISKEQLVKDKEDAKAKNGGDNLEFDFSKVTVADLKNITPEEKVNFQIMILGAITDVEEFDISTLVKTTDAEGNTVYTSKDGKVKITIDKDGNATIEKDGKKELAISIDKAGNVTIVTKDGKVLAIPRDDAFKQRSYVPQYDNTASKVDKSKLELGIRNLDSLIASQLDQLDAAKAKEAKALLAEAKEVFGNPNATQAEVDAMVKRLEEFKLNQASVATDDQAANNAANASNGETSEDAADDKLAANVSNRNKQKELPNTGTSTFGTVLPAIAALLSGVGVFATKKKEDE